MVGKAKSIAHTSNAIDYGKNKMNAEEISRHNVIGTTGLEIENEFKVYQNLNCNAKFNTISVVLSPETEDGRRLKNEDFKKITESYLEKMNLREHQHIAFVHRDVDHTHIHLYVNRIDNKGKAYNDSFIGLRSQHKAHEVAISMNLASEKEVMASNNIIKAEILSKHREVIANRPKTFQDYISQMKERKVDITPTINRQNEIQGFKVKDLKTNKEFKASQIHRSMSGSNLLKSGLKNDLNHNLDTTLKRVQGKQISKSHSNKKLDNTIPKEIKNQVGQFSKNGVKSVSQVLGKQKITREEFKYIKDIQNPLIKVEIKNVELERLESISKDIEYAKNLQKLEDSLIEKPNNNLKLELDR